MGAHMGLMDPQRASKRRKTSNAVQPATFAKKGRQRGSMMTKESRVTIDSSAVWNSEQRYELGPRQPKAQAKFSSRLPIKTAEGALEQFDSIDQDGFDSVSSAISEDEGAEAKFESAAAQAGPERLSPHQEVLSAKEELARVASHILEDPEENISGLRTLARLSETKNVTVKTLVLITQMSVFRDLIPGYRIRPQGELDSGEKLSKETRQLRSFEQGLVSAYQTYLKDLSGCASTTQSNGKSAGLGLGNVAIDCACTLLLAVPHFNFRAELFKILIDKLASRDRDADFVKCIDTLAKLFEDDEDGTPSFEAVTMISKMIKTKNFVVDEMILSTFLHLRLLSEFSSKASKDRVDENHSDEEHTSMKKRPKKEFRTKKQRKFLKEKVKVDKEFREADAIVDREQRDHMQAETLKLVFTTYFRILKAEEKRMIGPVLEGLAKFAHLINQDFFGDLLEVLKDLIKKFESQILGSSETSDDNWNSLHQMLRPLLLCNRTAFALLEGQDAAKSAPLLGLDLTYFINSLFRHLLLVAIDPDLELSGKTAQLIRLSQEASGSSEALQASSNAVRVNLQTTSALFLRAVSAALGPRSTPPIRLAAFTKQLSTGSLHVPEKTSLAMVALLVSVAKMHTQKIAALWNTEERKGDGSFNPEGADIANSNPFAATIWEGELLKHHFSPTVRESAKSVTKIVARTN